AQRKERWLMKTSLWGMVLFVLLLTGCRRGPELPVVYGTVSMDGKPIQFGFVTFYSSDGNRVGGGPVSDQGRYRANVKPGDVKVCFAVDAAMAGMDEEMRAKMDANKYTMPKANEEVRKHLQQIGGLEAIQKYLGPSTTPFALTVQSGEQSYDVDIVLERE